MKVAIVGAGMAGLACADFLVSAGHHAVVFDKSRGVGGRMATRRIETGDATYHFDHGCQYFTASSARFRHEIEAWSAAGLVANWPEAGPHAWVAVPGMNALARHLASRHDIVLNCHVRMLNRQNNQWFVMSDSRVDGPFDTVIIAVPPEQAAPILSLHDFAMARIAAASASIPCWTLMLALAEPIAAPSVMPPSDAIAWASRNNSKPGRGDSECWVAQASAKWTAAHLECTPSEVEQALMAAFAQQAGPLPDILASNVHRWRYAHCGGTEQQVLWNPVLNLGACGDWLIGCEVESAYQSGAALAEAICAGSGNGRAAATA